MINKTISVLIFDLSDNGLVRVYPMIKVLSRRYRVEVIGVVFGDQIYNPYQNEFQFKVISRNKKRNRFTAYLLMMKDLIKSIEGDVIYAFKPKLFSFGVGLLAKIYYKIPLVLDIEDLETVNWIGKSFASRVRLVFGRLDFQNEFFNYVMERFVPLADDKIVVSKYLQDKFGGTRIVHGADVNVFNPMNFNKQEVRSKLELKHDDKYILFSGMPREHKGIEELLKAIMNIDNKNLKLLIVGGDVNHKYYKKLLSIGQNIIIPVGSRPHDEMPSYLAASDIVVLPQRETTFAMAQVPAKVFEAMAMEKPIISTNVSDLSEILDGCGIVIDPITDTTELENKIKLLIDNTSISESLGVSARRKCIAEYSWDRMEARLFPIFDRYLQL